MPAETRERILEAAFRRLSRKGYENTTVKDIAEEAAVAPGLVHYYFKSKQALVLAVLVMCCDKLQQPGLIDSADGALQAFEHFKATLRDDRDSNSLYVELLGVGLHDPEVGAGILQFVREDRGNIEAAARNVLAARELPSEGATALAGAVGGGTLTSGNSGSSALEYSRANKLIDKLSTGQTTGTSFLLVFSSKDQLATAPAFRSQVESALAPIQKDSRVTGVDTPYNAPTPAVAQSLISKDGHQALVQVGLKHTGNQAAADYAALRQEVHAGSLS